MVGPLDDLNLERYQTLELKLKFCLHRIPDYTGFTLNRIPNYTGFSLHRISGYTGFTLHMIPD